MNLVADDGEQNVVVVRAAPAEDVHALLVALLFQLVDGIFGAGNETNTVTFTFNCTFPFQPVRSGCTFSPDWPMTALIKVLLHIQRCHVCAQEVMGIHRKSEVSINQTHKGQGLFTARQVQLLIQATRTFIVSNSILLFSLHMSKRIAKNIFLCFK